MNDSEDICGTCKLNQPWGCGTSIHDMDVVKGIGVVDCKQYTRKENRYKFYDIPKAIEPTKHAQAEGR